LAGRNQLGILPNTATAFETFIGRLMRRYTSSTRT